MTNMREVIIAGILGASLYTGCNNLETRIQDRSTGNRAEAAATKNDTPNRSYLLTREEFEAFGRRAVRESLRDVATFVTEAEYDAAIQQEGATVKKPAFGFIYVDDESSTEMNPSRGMASIIFTLAQRYEVHVVGIQASRSRLASREEFEAASRMFSLTTLPGTRAYRVDGTRLVFVDGDSGGITDFEPVNGRGGYECNVVLYSRFIEGRLIAIR